ncbi:MAG: carboxypeptidase-like regulatory domain-containing protein [Bacteroidales bacterium]
MKTIITLLLLLLFTQKAFVQQKVITVSGQLTDKNGEALPGVNIVIKGTNTGKVTDIDGNYSIEAPVGSVLQFNFIGFLAEELVVTEDMADDYVPANTTTNQKGKSHDHYAKPISDKIFNRPGVATAVFSDSSARFSIYDFQYSKYNNLYFVNRNQTDYKLNPNTVWKIKPGKSGNEAKTVYSVKTNKIVRYYLPKVYYFTSYSVDEVSWFPERQNNFSQGLPVSGESHWFGPETGVPYSWGPDIRMLEYDGYAYDYDKNGRLVTAGTGNGIPAEAYGAMKFFTNGSYLTNKIQIEDKFGQFGYSLSYQNNHAKGIIPDTENKSNNSELKFDYNLNGRLMVNGNVMYHDSEGQLALSGSNLLRIMKSVYLTPPAFDNSQSYLSDDGTMRSFNPAGSFNPYWLINNIPDNEKNSRFIAGLHAEKRFRMSELKYEMVYDNQKNNGSYGISENDISLVKGILTERNESYRTIHNEIRYTHTLRDYSNRLELDLTSAIQADYCERNLYREDSEGYSKTNPEKIISPINLIDTLNNRSTVLVNTTVFLRYRNWFNIKLANGVNWSSTSKNNRIYLNPNLGVNFYLSDIPFWRSGLISFLRVYGNYAGVVTEAPINYKFGKNNALLLSPVNSNHFYEWNELFFNADLDHERQQKFSTGLGIGILRNHVTADIGFFRSKVSKLIVPVITGNEIQLVNGADVRDRGFELSASIFSKIRFLHIEKAMLNLSFGINDPFVTRVYEPYSKILTGGNQSMGSYLIENQPHGVFYGSRYLKNEDGLTVIGTDGYPLADSKAGIIGNPNPDWTMGLEGKVEWKNISLMCLIDIRKGGDVWNSTLNTMNYFGISDRTGRLRNTYNYLFDGVMQDGTPNTIPVDFANPAKGLDQNRWVRYGETGVDEEAITDGSYFRVKEAKIEYSFRLGNIFRIPVNARIAIFGRNLLIHSNSKLLPWNTFLSQTEGNGLDYFNLPGTRSYGIAFDLSF